MPLVPAFELGLWNAWIFMACLFLIMYAVGKLKKGEAPKDELEALSKTGKRIFDSAMLVNPPGIKTSSLASRAWRAWLENELAIGASRRSCCVARPTAVVAENPSQRKSSCFADIAMVKATYLRQLDHPPQFRRVVGSEIRRVAVQRQVTA